MQPAALGQYKVERRLGQGGMGQVFLAHDPERQAPVAIKLLHAQAQAAQARFRREFRLLQKLSHPYVVGVYAFGTEKDDPFLVMEFIQGKGLDSWIGDPPDTPEATQRAITISLQIAEGLDYIHRQGIVHRDLKPENILVTGEDIPKITDFGLARNVEASVMLTQAGTTLGTVLYAPPEQLRGQVVDHRADLYAFGAILYRLFTGQVPFEGQSLTDIMLRVLREEPVPPGDLNPSVSSGLEALILQLLAKDSIDRPDSASDVQQELTKLLGSVSAETESPPPAAPPVTIPDEARLLEPPFLGRETLLGTLLKHECRALIIEGDAGLGKSRLVREIGRERTAQRWRVLEAHPGAGYAVPYQVVADWLRPIVMRPSDAIQSLLESEAPTLAHLVPELDASPQPLPAEQAQLTLITSAAKVFLKAASERSLMLVLEDLEHADESTLAFLSYALHNLSADSSLQFVFTCRADELNVKSKQFLSGLVRDELAEREQLTPLKPEDISRMVRAMLGGPVDRPLVDQITERSRGNPWITAEILRHLIETGQLKRKRGYWEWNHGMVSLPATLHEAFEEKLQRLDEQARDLLAVAAVIGEEVPFDLLLELGSWDEDTALDHLEELLRAGILTEERRGRDEIYRFVNPVFQDVALASLSQRKKRRLYARHAEILETEGAPPHLLARQWSNAGDIDRAAQYAVDAVRQAEQVYALAEVESYVRHVLEQLGEDHPLYPEFRLYLGKICSLTGRSDEAEPVLQEALELADEALKVQVRLALADLYRRQGQWHEAIGLVEQDLSERSPFEAWRLIIACLRFAEKYDRALAYIRQAEQHFTADVRWQAHLLHQEAAVIIALRKYPEAKEKLRVALELSEASEQHSLSAHILTELGRTHEALQELDDAITHYQKASERFTKISDWRGLATCQLNIANILAEHEGDQAALKQYQEALKAGERGGYRDIEAAISANMAESLIMLGDFHEAIKRAEHAVAIYDELTTDELMLISLLVLVHAQILASEDPQHNLDKARSMLSSLPHYTARLELLAGWHALLIHNAPQAVTHFTLAHQHDPKDIEVTLALVQALQLAGHTDAAKEMLETLSPTEGWQNIHHYLCSQVDGMPVDANHLTSKAETQGKWEWAQLISMIA